LFINEHLQAYAFLPTIKTILTADEKANYNEIQDMNYSAGTCPTKLRKGWISKEV
jgi:hypothetical protein